MNTVIQDELDKMVVSVTKIRSELSFISANAISATWTAMPNYGASTLPSISAPEVSNTGLVRLEDSEYIEVHTGLDNCYVTREFSDILTSLVQKNFWEFPSREFKKLYISAAGRQDGIDPIGLHGGGKAIDAHYFAFSREPLFDTAGRVTSVFDLKRQLAFIKDFIAAFPRPIIYLNDRIYFAILATDIGRTIKDYLHPAGGHDDHIHLGYK